jgi:hypothetical protein
MKVVDETELVKRTNSGQIQLGRFNRLKAIVIHHQYVFNRIVVSDIYLTESGLLRMENVH